MRTYGTGTGVTALVLIVLLAAGAFGQEFGDISQEEWDQGPPVRYQEANAVILFDNGRLEVTKEGISLHRHVRIKILTQAGADEAADVEILFWEDDQIKDFKACTYTADGDKHKVSRRDLHTKEAAGYRVKTFAFPSVEPGAILEYKYRNFNKRFTQLDPWYFQNSLYTLRSEFTLSLAAGFTYTAVANKMGSAASPRQEENKRKKISNFVYAMNDLWPLRDEPYSGAHRNYASALHFQLVSYRDDWNNITFVKNWADLGAFFDEKVVQRYLDKDKGLEDYLDQAKGDAATGAALLRNLYDHVRQHVRLHVEPGTGYYVHEHLEDLIKEGYGSGEEKNMLLIALSRQAGLSAWPVLICTRDQGHFNPKIYQLQQFNHLIAYVETDQGGVYLDASSRYCPFGVLPSRCSVDGGFLLDGPQSQVVRVLTTPPKSYRMDRTMVSIDSAGVAHCTTTVSLSGYFSISYGRQYELSEDDEFFQERFLDHLDAEITMDTAAYTMDPETNRCEVQLVYRCTDLAESLDQHLLVKQPVMMYRSNPFTDERRFFPIDFYYPFTYHNVVMVHPGPTYTCTEPLTEVHLDQAGIRFVRQCQAQGEMLVMETKLDVTEPMIDPSRYEQVREVFGAIEQACSDEIAFSGSL